ncbi:MAG TPA: GTPase HflX [Actinobacteria bacterium]|nr:GTPase HflX [Actinomycetota bacterium]
MERAYLVAVLPGPIPGEEVDELVELKELLATAGARPVGQMIQRRDRPDPRTYFGKGKITELLNELGRLEPDLVVAEDEFTPNQQRHLEDKLDVRIIDRTALILDIFAQHAHTAEGKLQVELAQLEFNLTHMTGKGIALSRLGGGIGTRGPGETKLEVDRRVARRRIVTVRKRLKDVASSREVMRRSRLASRLPLIALAGYTNTGKSTLLNLLTSGSVSVKDRLFETLDPTTRAFEYEGQTFLVTDTVGFIRKLPHQLIEAFHSTLEETLVAHLILHIADASIHEHELAATITAVEDVLEGIEAASIPSLLVLNKSDLLSAEQEAYLRRRYPEAVIVSGKTGSGLEDLKSAVRGFFNQRLLPVRLLFPYGDGKAIGELYQIGADVEMESIQEGVVVSVRLPREQVKRFSRFRYRAEEK